MGSDTTGRWTELNWNLLPTRLRYTRQRPWESKKQTKIQSKTPRSATLVPKSGPASLQPERGERGVSERAAPTWPLRAAVSQVARSAVISAYVASLWLAGGAGRPEREVKLRPSRLRLLGWPRRSTSWNCVSPGRTKSAAGQRAADSF